MTGLARIAPKRLSYVKRRWLQRLVPAAWHAKRHARRLFEMVPLLAQDVCDGEIGLEIEVDGMPFTVLDKHGNVRPA